MNTLQLIIGTWQNLQSQAADPNTKAWMQQVIDQHKAHPSAGDIEDFVPGNGPDMPNPSPLAPQPLVNKSVRPESPATPSPARAGSPAIPTISPDKYALTKDEANQFYEKYATTLPPGLPAVYDMPIEGTDKTLRQLIEANAVTHGIPAILLAAQLWDESKAGLHNDEYLKGLGYSQVGKPSVEAVLPGMNHVTTTNPGDGQDDTGLAQMNPNTYKALIYSDNVGGGVVLPARPDLAHLKRENVEDAVELMTELSATYYKEFKSRGLGDSDADTWNYVARAYVSGPGGVVPGNPFITAALGNPDYHKQYYRHMYDFVQGVTPHHQP